MTPAMRTRFLRAFSGLFVLAASAAARPAMAQSRGPSAARVCAEAASSGQVLRDEGKLVEARARFVACAQPSCPKLIQKDCAEWQADVDARLPTVVVSAKDDAGHDVAAVSVTVDGAPFARSAADGRSTPVNPGRHTFAFAAPGHRPAERIVVVREGERARAVDGVLERLVKPREPEKEKVGDDRSADASPARGPGPLPFILGGLGVAGAATFVVLFSGIKSDKDALVGTPDYTESKRDELKTRLIVADAIGIASAAALVGSAALFIVSFTSGSSGAAAKGGVSLGGAFTPGGGEARASVRF